MKLAFDHIVHFSQDPLRAVEDLKSIGLHAVPGGRHANWGTFNGLCYFDLSYIEFLGLENEQTAERATENDLIRQIVEEMPEGQGAARLALRTNDIESLAQNLRKKGLYVEGPLPGSRKKADGSLIKWSMLFVHDQSELRLPFFIEWEERDETRRGGLIKQHMLAEHPRGNVKLDHVAIAVRDLEQKTKEWSQWFDLEVKEPYVDQAWQARCQKLLLHGGDLLFCTPEGEGRVEQFLKTMGERPFAVRLKGDGKKDTLVLDGTLYQFG